MEIQLLLKDKNIKGKEKTQIISELLVNKKLTLDALIEVAKVSKESEKATCIEAVEYVTKSKPEICTATMIEFAAQQLADKAPRVKWESARVIGNCAPLFPGKLKLALENLLLNSEHSGTVVRWSTAYALGEIVKLKNFQKELAPALEAIMQREEKNSIKKIYAAALKKIKTNK